MTLPITPPLQVGSSALTGSVAAVEGIDPSRLERVGAEFEAAFLSEMLKIAGFGRMPKSFDGGAGESGFTDLLVRDVARQIARSRPLGIGAQVAQELGRKAGA